MLNDLPKNWNDVTLFQWSEIDKANQKEWESSSERTIEIISILLNTTPDDEIFNDIEWEDIEECISKRRWVYDCPSFNFSKNIDNFIAKDFSNLTLGEFIDIEYFIENNESVKIIPIIYKKHKTDEWENIVFEPYKYNVDERLEYFYDKSVNKTYGLIAEYIKWRDGFLKSYENLFQESVNEEDEEDIELAGRERIDAKVEALENKAKSKWSWESILLGLSNGDVTKFDQLFDTSLILVFNTLSAKQVLGM
jgi:hypothetical protein